MNEKEFRKLKRSELIELIYELEVDLEKVQQENEQLRQKLDQKTSEIKNLTSLEQAVERLNRIYEVAVPSSGEEVVKEEDRLDEMLKKNLHLHYGMVICMKPIQIVPKYVSSQYVRVVTKN